MKKIILMLIILLGLVPITYGFGVTTPYWDDNPLIIAPGQSIEFSLFLQNMIGDNDLDATAKVSSGKEFVEILD